MAILTHSHGTPQARAIPAPFDADVAHLELPRLLHEEGLLRRALLRGGRPSPTISTRLAAVEAALHRESGAQ